MVLDAINYDDIFRIMEIIEEARQFLLSYGNMQWAGGYPSESLIENDAENGVGYKIEVEGKTEGYLAILSDDESYAAIDGKWISDGPYIAIHRLALSDAVRGRGLFPEIISKAAEIGRKRGAFSLRIDTDDSNQIMKHLLEKLGFIHTGYVFFEGSAKPAYELMLTPQS